MRPMVHLVPKQSPKDTGSLGEREKPQASQKVCRWPECARDSCCIIKAFMQMTMEGREPGVGSQDKRGGLGETHDHTQVAGIGRRCFDYTFFDLLQVHLSDKIMAERISSYSHLRMHKIYIISRPRKAYRRYPEFHD